MYNQGNISVNQGFTVIYGEDTLWLENIKKGNTLIVFNPNGTTQNYVISDVISDTELTLTTKLTQSFDSANYSILTDVVNPTPEKPPISDTSDFLRISMALADLEDKALALYNLGLLAYKNTPPIPNLSTMP